VVGAAGFALAVAAGRFGCGVLKVVGMSEGAACVLALGCVGDIVMIAAPMSRRTTAAPPITSVLRERSGSLTESGASTAGNKSRAVGACSRSVAGIGLFGGWVSKS
jgi:hypothetical protein